MTDSTQAVGQCFKIYQTPSALPQQNQHKAGPGSSRDPQLCPTVQAFQTIVDFLKTRLRRLKLSLMYQVCPDYSRQQL